MEMKTACLAGLLLLGRIPAMAADTPRFLPTGTMLRITVLNAIFSYNLDTPVIAELQEPAAFGKREVLPEKTKFLGRALVLKSHDRINIEFNLAVMPDGRELPIAGIALSPDGSAGIPGVVKQVHDSVVASAALKGAISGAAEVIGGSISPVVGQAGQAAAQEAGNEVDAAKEQIDTLISVPAFTHCLIYFGRRLELDVKGGNKQPSIGKRS